MPDPPLGKYFDQPGEPMTSNLLNGHSWNEDPAPREVVERLRAHGHEAYLAGGCVRDLLLGRIPHDYDVATSATPDEVAAAFPKTIPVKPELGVTLVLWRKARIEVTAFRAEGPYLDGRRPSSISRTDAAGDVRRRDFTVNGLLLDPVGNRVLDHVGGLADLQAGILRCIGDPRERFAEDRLRVVRAVRFAVRLGFAIDQATWEAMAECAPEVAGLSGERLHDEFERMWRQGPFAPCLRLMARSGIFSALSPALGGRMDEAPTLRRLAALCARPAPEALPFVALLGLPLLPWWDDPARQGISVDDPGGLRAPSATRASTAAAPLPEAAAALFARFRSSRGEIEAATLCWTRWPEVWTPLPRPPSFVATLARERHVASLRALLGLWQESQPDCPWPVSTAFEAEGGFEGAPLPSPTPLRGDELARAGIAPGPAMGALIRAADRIQLDWGLRDPEHLLREARNATIPAP